MTLTYPQIDPVAFRVPTFGLTEQGWPVHWYALAYVAGIVLGWRYVLWLNRGREKKSGISALHLDDFVFWATLGIILGGRLGYVVFYAPQMIWQAPAQILRTWDGGMSFHGGALGVIAAIFLFAWKRRLSPLALADLVTAAVPIGLLFGRMANFINGELFGRVTASPLGMVFPRGGALPRHPSQLYEAGLEGVALFLLLYGMIQYRRALDRPGLISGLFLIGYGAARTVLEQWREPDAHLGFVMGSFSMGQMLSVPMIIVGGVLVYVCTRRRS